MLRTRISYSEKHPCLLAVCDHKCEKAFGLNARPNERSEVEPDDVVWFADDEAGEAPSDPGSYEGGHGKPFHPDKHNKWCVRECERSALIDPGKPIRCPDLSARLYNQPWLHGVTENSHIETGETFVP